MTPGVGGILYDADAALYPGASMPEPEEDTNRPELLLVEADAASAKEDQELTGRELEAKAAADCIRQVLAHQQIWDSKQEAFRPARYGDIVILLRSLTGWGDIYARILTAEGIPAHTESRTGYFTTIEIQTILNLLRVVDNPRQDIPLAAVQKSMIGGFTDRELALIKSIFPDRPFYEACMRYREEGEDERIREKLCRFYKRIGKYRKKAVYLSIHEFLNYVLEDTGYGDYLAAQPGGVQRSANVHMLVERAIAFENTSYRGLFHFVRYMEQLQSYNEDFGEAGITGENEDAVRIMTIHKSKGLEFPVVIVGGLGKNFNRQDTRSRVVIHPELGLGVDYVNLKYRTKTPTLPKRVMQKALDLEMLGEELRVLYVAFTRAKEKLILLGSTTKLDDKLEKCRASSGGEALSFLQLSTAGTYLDWLLPAIAGAEHSPFSVTRITPESQAEEAVAEQISMELLRNRLQEEELPEKDENFAELLKERLSYSYPYAAETRLRVKLSVSELKKAGQAEEEDADSLLYPQEEIVPYIPKFMQEGKKISGAARGTAYHKVLECVDLSQMYHSEKVKEALEKLVKEGYLTGEMAAAVQPYDIYAFAQTELAKRMTAAGKQGRLYTEQPFVIRQAADRLGLGYESSEPVLIQGIIDAYFYENDEIVIVDYKTDYVQKGEELLEKYGSQLDYYETALRRLTGKRVKEKLIYSFCLKETIEVDVK
jgi:ATP-dependent helicase/nuclease subunit A